MQSVTRATLIIGLVFLAALRTSASPTQDRVTILYDAFGKPSGMKKDWGYSALVEYGGKRILFDTGNNAEIFAQNVKVSGVDLKKLDFAVISHRHGDHTGGMNYLLTVNPQVKIFAPKEGFGVFGASLPGTFYRQDASLADYMRYYNGKPPQMMTFGTPWPSANFVLIDGVTEAAPGISVIATVSQTPGTRLRSQIFLVRLPSRHQLEQNWRLATACRRSSSAAASHCSTAYNPPVRRLGDRRFQAVRRQILQIPLSARRSLPAGSPSKDNSCRRCDPRAGVR